MLSAQGSAGCARVTRVCPAPCPPGPCPVHPLNTLAEDGLRNQTWAQIPAPPLLPCDPGQDASPFTFLLCKHGKDNPGFVGVKGKETVSVRVSAQLPAHRKPELRALPSLLSPLPFSAVLVSSGLCFRPRASITKPPWTTSVSVSPCR